MADAQFGNLQNVYDFIGFVSKFRKNLISIIPKFPCTLKIDPLIFGGSFVHPIC